MNEELRDLFRKLEGQKARVNCGNLHSSASIEGEVTFELSEND